MGGRGGGRDDTVDASCGSRNGRGNDDGRTSDREDRGTNVDWGVRIVFDNDVFRMETNGRVTVWGVTDEVEPEVRVSLVDRGQIVLLCDTHYVKSAPLFKKTGVHTLLSSSS